MVTRMNFKQISRSSSFGILNLFITLATQIIIPTLLTSFLGLSAYGIWVVLSATASILMIAELGIGNAISIEMRKIVSRDLPTDLESIFRALRVLFMIWNFTCLVTIISISLLTNLFNINGTKPEPVNLLILSLIMFSTALSSYQSLVMGILKFRNDFILSQKLQFYFRATELTAVFFTITTGNSLLILAVVITLCRLINTLILELLSKVSFIGQYEFSSALHLVKRMKKPIISNLVTIVGHWFRLQGLVLVIGSHFGLEVAGIFAICRTVTSGGRQLSDLLHKNFGAIIIEEVAKGKSEALRVTIRYLKRSLIAVNVANLFFVFGFSDLMFNFMTDSRTVFPAAMLYSVLFLSISENISLYILNLKYALNEHFRDSLIYSFSGAFALITLIFIAPFSSIESLIFVFIAMNFVGSLVARRLNGSNV